MLEKRTYIAPAIAIALILPGSAAAAAPEGEAPKVGISAARPLPTALAPPLARFNRTVAVVNERLEVRRRARQRRRRRELYASLPGGVSLETLESIAACESGGDPSAVSSDGTYRGKYQFDYGTWESVGGSGDPAAASEAEQNYRAALLYSRSGSSPWPVCG